MLPAGAALFNRQYGAAAGAGRAGCTSVALTAASLFTRLFLCGAFTPSFHQYLEAMQLFVSRTSF